MVKVLGKLQPEAPDTGLSQESSSPIVSGLKGLARNIISPALTAGETVLGLPGDIAQGFANILGVEQAPGQPARVPISSQGLRENIREPIAKAFGAEKLLLPQGKLEERLNDFAGDVAGLVFGKFPVGRAAKVAGLGNLAGFFTHQLGGGPGLETGVKVGTMLLSSLHGGRKQLAQQAQDAYSQVEEAIGNKNISIKPIENKLLSLQDEIKSGGVTPAKKAAEEQIIKLSEQLSGDQIPAKNLWEFKKDINSLMSNISQKNPLHRYYKRMIGLANEGLNELGPQVRPILTKADKIYGDLARSNMLGNLINDAVNFDSIKNPYIKNALKGLGSAATGGGAAYGLKALTGLPYLGAAAGLGTVGLGINESAKLIHLLSNSPQARKTYTELISSAAKGSLANLPKAAARLDKIADQFDKKEQPQLKKGVKVLGQLPG